MARRQSRSKNADPAADLGMLVHALDIMGQEQQLKGPEREEIVRRLQKDNVFRQQEQNPNYVRCGAAASCCVCLVDRAQGVNRIELLVSCHIMQRIVHSVSPFCFIPALHPPSSSHQPHLGCSGDTA